MEWPAFAGALLGKLCKAIAATVLAAYAVYAANVATMLLGMGADVGPLRVMLAMLGL